MDDIGVHYERDMTACCRVVGKIADKLGGVDNCYTRDLGVVHYAVSISNFLKKKMDRMNSKIIKINQSIKKKLRLKNGRGSKSLKVQHEPNRTLASASSSPKIPNRFKLSCKPQINLLPF